MATKHESLEDATNSKSSSSGNEGGGSVKKTKTTTGDGKASIAGSVFNLANAVCTFIPQPCTSSSNIN